MLSPLPLRNVTITDPFFTRRIETARTVSIPYMWKALNDQIEGVAPSGCIANFAIAAGEREGGFTGFVFQDSDLWKWLEGVAYSLESHPDPALERQADEAIALAGRAQQPDGYLDTYYIINGLDKRFTNLRDNHELYVAGHMFEAACAYYRATGKRAVLDIACRFADCLCGVFGKEEGKLRGYPGHEEAEMGLARLYGVTGEERYLRLAAFFLNERGSQPHYFTREAERRGETVAPVAEHEPPHYWYHQAHLPVREQTVGSGHAVRQGYLLAGMAEVGALNGDATLIQAADRVFRNIVARQMYVTGGVGATPDGEAFTFDYDLPPERCYTETCASIAMMMTAARLNRANPNALYGDTLERELYNGMLAGISLDGTRYFYMNPLEVWPIRCERRRDVHIDDERQGWFGCACCPPNVLRTLTGLGQYLCAADSSTLLIDQYVSATLRAELGGGEVEVRMTSEMPWEGSVTLQITGSAEFTLMLRVPAWAKGASLSLNGEALSPEARDGFWVLTRAFHDGDTLALTFPMRPRFLTASAHVPNYAGKVALARGPLVYCAEEADNGRELWRLSALPGSADASWKPDLLDGVTVLTCPGTREETADALYSDEAPTRSAAPLRFVPYYAWGNRGKGEMSVWVRRG